MSDSLRTLRLADSLKAIELCKSDPVRPNIPIGWRVAEGSREVYYIESESPTIQMAFHQLTIDSVLCLAYLNDIPVDEDELLSFSHGNKFAIFYTVWSNTKGMGRQIIMDTMKLIRDKNIHNWDKWDMRYVTMSPKTKMARDFHLRNGAELIQKNPTTYNFEYKNVL